MSAFWQTCAQSSGTEAYIEICRGCESGYYISGTARHVSDGNSPAQAINQCFPGVFQNVSQPGKGIIS